MNRFNLLTDREMQIVLLVARQQLTNHEMAAQLQVDESTVKCSLSKIYDKTGACTRLELMMLAKEHGLI